MVAQDEEQVHLGYVGRQLKGDEALDLRLSRVGGVPVWSEAPASSSQASNPYFFKCKLCGQSMALVAQISAGYEGARGRALHVLACPRTECHAGSDSAAWRVLRSMGLPGLELSGGASKDNSGKPPGLTLPESTAGYPVSSAEGDDWGVPMTDVADSAKDDDWGAPKDDDWGAPASDDWGAPMAVDATADAEIESLLLAREAAPKPEKVKPAKKVAADVPVPDDDDEVPWYMRGTSEPCHAAAVWPCFALEIYDEPAAEGVADTAGAHEKELYERYMKGVESKDDEAAIGPESTLPVDLDTDRKDIEVEVEADEFDIDLDDEDADGSGGTWFARFQRRLERSATQVVRYSWGGSPLWMSQPPKEVMNGAGPPLCSLCGGARSFELQLLPTLAYQMQMACSEPGAEVKMEWGTAAVYTCSKDCAVGDFCEEFVVVQAAV